MKDVDAAWVAGLAEGEAYIGMMAARDTADGKRCNFVIEMTDKDVLESVAALVGRGNVNGPYTRPDKENKESWRWATGQKHDLQILLARIQPWMHERRAARIQEIQHRFLKLIGVPTRVR